MALCNAVAFPSRKHLEAEIGHKELQMKARLRKRQQYSIGGNIYEVWEILQFQQ